MKATPTRGRNGGSQSEGYRYDAFISYSHAEIQLAKRLSERIRRYRPPRQLRLSGRRLVPFRDVEQLTASGDLSGTLVERIRASNFLVVLCSPTAARSKYVTQEIETFLERRDPSFIILVLCSGSPDESIPSCLKAGSTEPLYVNLTDVASGFAGRKRFVRETLRIIAALYQVDYSILAREDQIRRQRLRILGAATAVVLAVLSAAIYLIITVEPDVWADQQLPKTGDEVASLNWSNPLMPIREIAFRKDDPSIQLYKVRDAEYHRQKPGDDVSLQEIQFETEHGPFEKRILQRLALAGNANLDSEQSPFARVRFRIEADSQIVLADGVSNLFLASLSPDGNPTYYQVLSIRQPADDSSTVERYAIQNLVLRPGFSALAGWPLEQFRDRNLLPFGARIQGSFEDLTGAATVPISYYVSDPMDEFRGAIGPLRFDTRIASSYGELEVAYEGGEPIPLSDVDGELEVWDQLIDTGDWATFEAPVLDRIALHGVQGSDTEERLAAIGDRLDDYAGLASHIAASEILEMDGVSLDVVTRESQSGTLRGASLVGMMEQGVSGLVTYERLLLYRGAHDSDWRPITIPTVRRNSRIVDLFPVEEAGGSALAVVSSEGLFLASDGGRYWRDYNSNETRLENAASIRLVAVGPTRSLYALVDNDLSGDGLAENHLFRLERRGWWDRLRIGIVRSLGPEDSDRQKP